MNVQKISRPHALPLLRNGTQCSPEWVRSLHFSIGVRNSYFWSPTSVRRILEIKGSWRVNFVFGLASRGVVEGECAGTAFPHFSLSPQILGVKNERGIRFLHFSKVTGVGRSYTSKFRTTTLLASNGLRFSFPRSVPEGIS